MSRVLRCPHGQHRDHSYRLPKLGEDARPASDEESGGEDESEGEEEEEVVED